VRDTLGTDDAGDGIRPDLDSPAITSPAVNKTNGDKRKVRAGPAALSVNGINESGTSAAPEPVARALGWVLPPRAVRHYEGDFPAWH
jgi:hypothetical protein